MDHRKRLQSQGWTLYIAFDQYRKQRCYWEISRISDTEWYVSAPSIHIEKGSSYETRMETLHRYIHGENYFGPFEDPEGAMAFVKILVEDR